MVVAVNAKALAHPMRYERRHFAGQLPGNDWMPDAWVIDGGAVAVFNALLV